MLFRPFLSGGEWRVPYSKIKYGRDNQALQIARAIESILHQHMDKLGGYMVTEQDMKEVHRRIQVYDDVLESRGGAKNGAVAENKRLDPTF